MIANKKIVKITESKLIDIVEKLIETEVANKKALMEGNDITDQKDKKKFIWGAYRELEDAVFKLNNVSNGTDNKLIDMLKIISKVQKEMQTHLESNYMAEQKTSTDALLEDRITKIEKRLKLK